LWTTSPSDDVFTSNIVFIAPGSRANDEW